MRKVVKYTFTTNHGKFKKGDTITCHPSTKIFFENVLKVKEDKPKRVRRTKEQIEAEKENK